MASLNKVLLIGNLGSDPELKSFDDQAIVTFRLATNRKYKDKNGKLESDTQWHTIKCWGKLAEIANKLLKKGHQVYLEGRLETRNYEDTEGKDRYFTDIVATNILLLGKREEEKI